MNATASPFLFQPGAGRMPPHLAGRQAEQNVLRRFADVLRAGEGPPSDLVLIGPRGNGKTVLMRWFEQDCRNDGNPVDAVWLTPDQMPSLDVLATELAPPERFRAWLPDALSISLGPGQASWELQGRSKSFTQLLTARCRKTPLALLVDEAHTLDPAVGRALLNASQQVRSQAPFLLMLAGTPSLQAELNAMAATFWSRAEILGIGLLDEAATAEALARPLADHGLPFADAALQQVVAESQLYPYFIQLWGQALWSEAGSKGVKRIDPALVKAVRPAFAERRDTYYEGRRQELHQRGLDAAAARVAAAYLGKAALPEPELEAAIVGGGAETGDAAVALKRMQDLGYVWNRPGQAANWVPGIPSLMDYVRENTPAPGA